MAGNNIEININKKIIRLLRTLGKSRINLEFTYDEETYKTIFNISISSETSYGEHIFKMHMTNSCVDIRIHKNDTMLISSIDSMISGNAREGRRCFDPPLVTHGNGLVRITSTDVLQVLKTKLTLLMVDAFPHQGAPPPEIKIRDGANINGVLISKFNILRGKDAIYERYGYVSEELNKFKSKIQGLVWGEYMQNIGQLEYIYKSRDGPLSPLQDAFIKTAEETDDPNIKKLAANLDDPEFIQYPFIDIMKYIPLENDIPKGNMIKFGEAYYNSLSQGMFTILVEYYIEQAKKAGEVPLNLWIMLEFTLDKSSQQWNTYNARLKFTEYSVIDNQETLSRGRTTTRRTTPRRNRSRSRSRKMTPNKLNGGKRKYRK